MQHRSTPSSRSNPVRRLVALAPVVLAMTASLPVSALTISATFAGAYTLAQQAEVATAINFYQTTFSDTMTLNIRFLNSGGGLGSSSQFFYRVNYDTYLTALRNDKTSVADNTALTSLPNGTGPLPTPGQNSPVAGTGNEIVINRANAAAVGLNVGAQSNGTTTWDADIDLNLGLMSSNHASPTPGLYDLRSVAMHEINEVLGTPSNLGRTNAFFINPATAINWSAPMDLFRYDTLGARNFTTAGDNAYLSIDGGATTLVRFNQGLGGSGGDYSDFWSGNGTGNFGNNPPYRIQDAFSASGRAAEMGIETTMLDVIGYTIIPVPEPETYALMLAGLGLLGFLARRRKG